MVKIIIALLLSICISIPVVTGEMTPEIEALEKTITSFMTSVSMVKERTYLVGPVWIVALRNNEDPLEWHIGFINASKEEIYNIKILMILYNNNNSVNQHVLKIYDGAMRPVSKTTVEVRIDVKHTHIGFSAIIEK